MRPIRYVCLSDLHLGEEDSLLTALKPGTGQVDPNAPSPVLTKLAECLRTVLNGANSKPTLVLNGDVLELDLCSVETAASVFQQFLATVLPEGGELFREVVYIPGNHDHHIWDTTRERQYLAFIERNGPSQPIAAPWSTTKVFMDMSGRDRLSSRFLTTVARRIPHLKAAGFEVLCGYPNFGALKGQSCAVFHHGHFAESAYRLMSILASLIFPEQPDPGDPYQLEGENSAWISFFWSLMGSAPRVGSNIESIYEATNDPKALEKLTDNLAASIAARYNVPILHTDWGEKIVLQHLFREIIVKNVTQSLERQQVEEPLSDSMRQGLTWYCQTPLHRQIELENQQVPESMTFVFGHTHKPVEKVMPLDGYSQPVRVLNTGGWVVDTLQQAPSLGASVVLVDEDLRAASLRIYNQGSYAVSIREATVPGHPHSGLYADLSGLVQADREPWVSLGKLVASESTVRQRNLAQRIHARLPSTPQKN